MTASGPRLYAGQAGVLSVALMACAAAWSAPPSLFPSGTVRNAAPERAMWPDRAQWPIYYPKPARAGADGAGLGSPDELLLREFLDLHTAMQYERAADAAARLQAMTPDAAIAHYNRACTLARLCRVDDAIAALSLAIDRGWSDRRHLQIDPDLEILRRDPRFAAQLERVPAATSVSIEHSPQPVEAPGASVALIHRGRVVMQWDDGHGAPVGAGDLLRIASETWRQHAASASVMATGPGAGAGAAAPANAADAETLVVFCASPELARELAQLVEATGGRARLAVRTSLGSRTLPKSGAASPEVQAPGRDARPATGRPATATSPSAARSAA